MTNEQAHRQVVLIYGKPRQGKTKLADKFKSTLQLEEPQVLGLDDEYVSFVKTHYPGLDLDDLKSVIAAHFHCMLPARYGHAGWKAWGTHVAELVVERSSQYDLLVVEGYLLSPDGHPEEFAALYKTQIELEGVVDVILIEAVGDRYYLHGSEEPQSRQQVVSAFA